MLAERIWSEHCDRYDAVKPAAIPSLLRTPAATGCASLRERLRVYGGDLAKAEADCRHVLDVLEAEAVANIARGEKNPVQWFGERAWTAGTFSGALSKTAPRRAADGRVAEEGPRRLNRVEIPEEYDQPVPSGPRRLNRVEIPGEA